MLQEAQKHVQAEQQQAAERTARDKAKREPAQQLATTLTSLRSWQVGKPQLSIGTHDFVAARCIAPNTKQQLSLIPLCIL